MQSHFSEARVRQLSVFWCSLIIVGIFLARWMRVLPSIGVAGLAFTAILYASFERHAVRRKGAGQFLAFTGVYLLHVVAGFTRHSIGNQELQRDLVLELPFLALPLAFTLLPSWPLKYLRTLWMVLIACCLFASAGATFYYLQHAQQVEELYLESKVMPTEPDHIRFSLLITIAVLAGVVLLFNHHYSKRMQWLLAGIVIVLILFQHMLAVRSGLVSLYVVGICWLGWLMWRMQRVQAALISLLLLIVLAITSLLFPTLQNKIINTRADADRFSSVAAANNYSVTARLYSYQAGWELIKENPIFGVGKVDLSTKMAEQYEYSYPEIDPSRYILPHNQFIYNLAAYGVLGLIVFIISFYYALWRGFKKRNIMMLLVYSVVTVSFTVEYTLESHIGVLTGLFFLLLAMAPCAVEDSEVDSASYSTAF
jgi:O-antigen ligase